MRPIPDNPVRAFRFLSSLLFILITLSLLTLTHALAAIYQVRENQDEISLRTLSHLAEMGDDALGRKLWVWFTDKNVFDSETCDMRLAEVSTELNDSARVRRMKVFKGTLVDFYDIPVYEEYISRIKELGVEVIHPSRWLNAVSVTGSIEDLRAVSELPFVQKICFVRQGENKGAELSSDDPRRAARDYPYSYGPSFDQMNEISMMDPHTAGYNGAGVIVAMLDTGFVQDHPALAHITADGRLLAQWDFINNDGQTQNEPGDPEFQDAHGTITWSILAGFDEGNLIGPAFGASFLLAKTEMTSDEIPAEEDNWVAGAEWADANGADVISSSLAYYQWYSYSDMDGETAVSTIGATVAASRGIVVCNAMGNYGTQDWYFMGAPADADSILSVGAMQPDGEMWMDSSHGPTFDGRTKPEVVARGESVWVGVPWGYGHGSPTWYISSQGTSTSCPLVGGAAAVILSKYPDWTPAMVIEALKSTADNADDPDNHRGWGLIDVAAAMNLNLSDIADESIADNSQLAVSPNPMGDETRIRFSLPPAEQSVALSIYSIDGRRVQKVNLQGEQIVFDWNGTDESGRQVNPGVYFASAQRGDWFETQKIIVRR